MFLLSRRRGQGVMIGPNIRLTILAVRGKQVRLGFTAPGDIEIYRTELIEDLDHPEKTDPKSAESPACEKA